VGVLALLLATFFGMILPSAKVVDLSVKFSAASAGAAAKPSAMVVAVIAQIPLRFMNGLPIFIRALWRQS
jgi:hypothetical protein